MEKTVNCEFMIKDTVEKTDTHGLTNPARDIPILLKKVWIYLYFN
jgi:hypothetical protein